MLDQPVSGCTLISITKQRSNLPRSMMSQPTRGELWQELKAAGVETPKPYQQYTQEELANAVSHLRAEQESHTHRDELGTTSFRAPETPLPAAAPGTDPTAAHFFGYPVQDEVPPPVYDAPPVRRADPNELAGARQSQPDDEPIRTDPETGRVWFQEEVRKPATPKPRGRRVLRYKDSGSVKKTVKDGDYTETFEIPGDPANAREMEVKITLPSYQVGVYKDPRFPFKTVCYNENEGFALMDVQDYYGGTELVPIDVKRKYVENVLCYDIMSVIASITKEARELSLSGRLV
jgi:hypothetical protein